MKKSLSVLLILSIILSVFPLTAVNAADTLQDRTNINMDYKYDKTLSQVQREARDGQIRIMSDKDSGSVKWNHVSYLSYNYGDIREKLTSTNPDDKYIVLDKDSKVQLGYSAYETVEISSDKVLDLNGHTIQINDIRNKANGSDKFYQSDNSAHFNTVMFSITNGATLTIIDSGDDGSGNGTGEIYVNAYMVNPYKYSLKRYTTRDIFEVDDGNLVIYGGTFQAGRSKAQADDDTYEKIKAVVGSAVALATDVAGYATSLNSLVGQYEDISFNKKRELDKILKQDQTKDNPDSSKEQKEAATSKKDGSDAKAETKESTPTDNAENGKEGRNQTVAEKQQANNGNSQNKANANGTAQYDGNAKIADAKNAIANAAVNKDKINPMVDSAFTLADTIKGLFETEEGSVVTQAFLGTCVNVKNKGTFVSYGGKYIGYGMTPNIRNAVIECTKKGKVYIYDGLFEGRCGANIFNIVKASYNMTFEKDASNVMSAYGLTSNDKTGVFISGVQNGVGAVLTVPEESDIEFASTVKVIVNDRSIYNISRYSSKEIQVYTNNTFTVKPAENVVIQPAPDFIIKPVNIAVGQTVDLTDYVECKDKSVGLKFLSEVSDGRYTLDVENNTFTAVDQFNSSGHDTTTLNPYISFDMDGDGNNETFLKAVMTVTIYKNAEDIPTDNNVNLTVNILDADGKNVQTLTKTLVKNENTAMKVVELPEIKGLITNSVECTGDTFYASGSNIGTYSIRQDTTVTVKTMKASDITVTPYAKEAKLSKYMIVSTDGVHWTRTNNITGLTPATNYTLYYKQGKESLIYTKKFTTASKDYGFALGTEKITDLNNGTLEKDGWHYDENTNTLTLKNFTLTSKGTKTGSYSIGVSTYPRATAVIVADNDIIIELIGENTITKLSDSNTRHEDVIYGYGNITLTGNGNLTLTNTGYQYMSDGSGITSQKNIYLQNTGKLTINKSAGAFTNENSG